MTSPVEPPWLLSGPATPEINAALRGRIEQLLGDYDRVKANVGQMQRRLAEAEGHAETGDGSVKVTVGPRGELRELRLDPRAYRRFSPSELATEIIELTGQAAREVQKQVGEAMSPFLPEGVSVEQLTSGEVDPARWRPPSGSIKDLLETWLPRASAAGPAGSGATGPEGDRR
ncbi:MAG TPA: YbaB/EbfC family nucleoid-associated protein [Streptosporangiaceae bacterium]|nr:YbaB/EbfC family nucleoid-associated protein [Streptosporangiaceae bacterium]